MAVNNYLEPTQEAGRDFVMRGICGSVVMLNLLRFRTVAEPLPTIPHLLNWPRQHP